MSRISGCFGYLLPARGTPEFSALSQELYGSANDAFYVNAPRLKDLVPSVSQALMSIKNKTLNELYEKRYDSQQAAEILNNGYPLILSSTSLLRIKDKSLK